MSFEELILLNFILFHFRVSNIPLSSNKINTFLSSFERFGGDYRIKMCK